MADSNKKKKKKKKFAVKFKLQYVRERKQSASAIKCSNKWLVNARIESDIVNYSYHVCNYWEICVRTRGEKEYGMNQSCITWIRTTLHSALCKKTQRSFECLTMPVKLVAQNTREERSYYGDHAYIFNAASPSDSVIPLSFIRLFSLFRRIGGRAWEAWRESHRPCERPRRWSR